MFKRLAINRANNCFFGLKVCTVHVLIRFCHLNKSNDSFVCKAKEGRHIIIRIENKN